MSKSKSQQKLDAAIELGFLSERQVKSLDSERQGSNYPALELAIRKGMLSRKQLDILSIFAEPESVVPGYRIDGFLGQGGVGTVYKATQIRMDRPVAIKTIQRSAARNDLTPKRFEREARIVGQLRHPNIIPAFDFGMHNDKLYLIMEFVDGIDAEKHLLKGIKFPELHGWFIARQVCHALDNAHQLGIIHRDIKPGNLILTEPPAGSPLPAGVPFVKVADFGLAKFSDQQTDASLTMEHSVSGTPFYMSSEQIQSLEIDHRSDIYSLGTTIWHLITGSPPIMGNGPLDIITSKMKLEDSWMKQPGTMSQQGFQLLEGMCRHDRDLRIGDYGELSREIDSVIEFLSENEPQLPEAEEPSPDLPAAKFTTIRDLAKTFVFDETPDSGATQDFVTDQDFVIAPRSETDDLDSMPTGQKAQTSADIEGIEKSKQRWHRPTLWAAVLACGLILPVGIYVFPKLVSGKADIGNPDNNDSPTGDSSNQPRIRLSKFSSLPLYLFKGDKLDPTQKFTGTWEPATGGEGAPVLSGRGGFRDFRCRDQFGDPLEFYRFVCGFRHHESDLIEFSFFKDTEAENSSEVIFSVVISPEAATLKFGETSQQCELQQFNEEQVFGYHQFRFESQPNYWRIELDHELLGEFEKPEDFDGADPIVRLAVEGDGSAHFEDIQLNEFADESNK